jgi:hypothetical protein
MKNLLKNIIRITISGGVLFFVLRRINFSEIQQLLKDANVGIFLLSFLVYGVMMALCALRWHRLLYVQKVSLPYKRTLAYYLIGFFYNNILPTVIGGGVVRALYAGKAKNKNKEAFSSMLAELVIGGWGLLIFVLIASLFWLRKLSLYKIILPFFGGLVLSTAFLYLFFEREVMKKLGSITQRIKIFGINNKIKEFYESLYIYKDKKLLLIESVFLSFGVQALIGLMNFLIGISLGFKLPIMSYIIYPVIIGLLTAIPITINGLGIREWGYSFFFAQVGLTSSSAVILSLLFYFVGVIGSLAGAFVFPFVKFSKVKDE